MSRRRKASGAGGFLLSPIVIVFLLLGALGSCFGGDTKAESDAPIQDRQIAVETAEDTEPTADEVTEDAIEPVIEESEEQKVEETVEPVIEETEKPLTEEVTEPPVDETTEEPPQEQTRAEVSAKVHGTDFTVSLPADTEVWLPATGEKFHSVNDCGRMNPDKARQVTVDEAVKDGYEACERCYG